MREVRMKRSFSSPRWSIAECRDAPRKKAAWEEHDFRRQGKENPSGCWERRMRLKKRKVSERGERLQEALRSVFQRIRLGEETR